MAKARQFPWSQSELRSLIHYEPTTGVFTRNGKFSGSLRKDGRWQLTIKGVLWLRARLAWYWMTGEQIPNLLTIDHANRDKSDDRWENLRLATWGEQAKNRDSVEFKAGYWWNNKQQRWQVRCITKDGDGRRKTHCFGEFTCEERAKQGAAIMKEEMNARLCAA